MKRTETRYICALCAQPDGSFQPVRFPIAPFPCETEPPVIEKKARLEGSVRAYTRMTVRAPAGAVAEAFRDGVRWQIEADWTLEPSAEDAGVSNDTHATAPETTPVSSDTHSEATPVSNVTQSAEPDTEGILPPQDAESGTDVYDRSAFSIAGDVVDHRDGRVTFYMLRPTEEERRNAALEEENARLLFENLTGSDFSAV